MRLYLKVFRQKDKDSKSFMEDHTLENISPDMSFLEMFDMLNEKLLREAKDPVVFEHDCREGICGSCSMVINGSPHGPESGTTTCQLHMRSFQDGDTIVVEPFRARAFPIIKDLMVDRSSFDRVMKAGGYNTTRVGSAPDANAMPIPKARLEKAMDAAACIGCGACVAVCKNASAMLFVSAKIAHLGKLPQGQVEKKSRVRRMLKAMDEEGFGSCSNTSACEAVCPKNISVENIAYANRDFFRSKISKLKED